MTRRSQGGYTSIELASAITIGLLIVAFGAFSASARMRLSKLEQTVEAARVLAMAVEKNQVTLATSAEQPDGSYAYTYRNQQTFVTVAAFNTTFGTNLFPVTTPYGTPFEIRHRAGFVTEVRFQYPLTAGPIIAPVNATANTIPGGFRLITVWAEQTTARRNKVYRLWRVNFMGEAPRY